MSDARKAVCKYCQTSLIWNWNFFSKEPILTNEFGHHHDCKGHAQDVFPGWCKKCNALDLVWIRKNHQMELTEAYGLPHTCEQDQVIEDISAAKCLHCKTNGLLWLNVLGKFTLVNTNGEKHSCAEYTAFAADWAEAKRINYALEKKWLKSIPDGTECQKCNGRGFTSYLSNNKRLWKKFNSTEPITVVKRCLKCKQLGTFTKSKKQFYLRQLRRKYWPYNGAYHKWKNH